MAEHRHPDADVRADVLQALVLDPSLPSTVDAWIEDGFATLSATVDRQYERDQAEIAAGKIVGDHRPGAG